jgi:DNA-binding GntR family transcriptional regulator
MHPKAILQTAQASLAETLRNLIVQGKIPAGGRIKQDAVAERFGVSRIPVREALRELSAEGLVQIIPRRGVVVNPLSTTEVIELYEMRELLETLAVRLAVPRLSTQRLLELEELMVRMQDETNPPRWLDYDSKFHEALYQPSDRNRLCDIIGMLRRNTARYLHIAVMSDSRMRLAQEEHGRILDACKRRDADGAVNALRWQLSQTRDFLLDTLTEAESQSNDDSALFERGLPTWST